MNEEGQKSRFHFKSVYFLYMLLFGVGVYLVIYHGPHLWNVFPLVFIFLCPLMHMMHHGKHGKHEGTGNEQKKTGMEDDKNNHKGCH